MAAVARDAQAERIGTGGRVVVPEQRGRIVQQAGDVAVDAAENQPVRGVVVEQRNARRVCGARLAVVEKPHVEARKARSPAGGDERATTASGCVFTRHHEVHFAARIGADRKGGGQDFHAKIT